MAKPRYGVAIPTNDPFVADAETALWRALAFTAFGWAAYWRQAPDQEGFDVATDRSRSEMFARAEWWEARGNEATEMHDVAAMKLSLQDPPQTVEARG